MELQSSIVYPTLSHDSHIANSILMSKVFYPLSREDRFVVQ